MKKLSLLFVASILSTSSFAAVQIDNMDGSMQLTITGLFSGQTTRLANGGAIGGVRTLFGMNVLNSFNSITDLRTTNGQYDAAPGPGVRNRSVLLYGQDINGVQVDMNADLVDGTNDRFLLDFLRNEQTLQMEVWIGSTATGGSVLKAFESTVSANAGGFTHQILFSSILITPAALQDADHIELVFDTMDGGDFALTNVSSAVPEPASVLALSLGGLALLRRRRSR